MKANTSSLFTKDLLCTASNKALILNRGRGIYQDYVDLVFILQSGITLQTIINEAEKRYKAMFDEKLFLEQLDYMEDITDLAIEFVGNSVIKEEVHEYLHQTIKEYVV